MSKVIVADKQSRPITADRIIEAARAAGFQLMRGCYYRERLNCGCAAGAIAVSETPAGRRGNWANVMESMSKILSVSCRRGLSAGFEGSEPSPLREEDPESYLACHAIGREVWRRRHEAGAGGGGGER